MDDVAKPNDVGVLELCVSWHRERTRMTERRAKVERREEVSEPGKKVSNVQKASKHPSESSLESHGGGERMRER